MTYEIRLWNNQLFEIYVGTIYTYRMTDARDLAKLMGPNTLATSNIQNVASLLIKKQWRYNL